MKLRDVNWEIAAKIGAGVLLAIAIVVSLPGLLESQDPAPLPPDVGVAVPPAGPTLTAPPPPVPKPPKPRRPKRHKAARKHKPKPAPKRHRDREAHAAPPPSTPVVAAPAPAPPPPGTHEDFGFERP